jgi:hypothetical protein
MVRNVQTLPQAIRVRKRIGIEGEIRLRPWGYEDQASACNSFRPSIKSIKQWVAVGKDAFMCFMRNRFRYESRQNLGKQPEDFFGPFAPLC